MEEEHEEVLYRRDEIKKTCEQILTEYDDQYCCVHDDTSEHIATAVTNLVSRMIETGLQMEIIEEMSGPSTSNVRFGHLFKDIFTNGRLIPVGSFAEGTKTSDPDEFDFLFQFSLEDVALVEGCGADRVKILSEGKGPWLQFLKDNLNLNAIGYHGVHRLFDNMLHLVERQITTKPISVDISLASGTLKFLRLSDQRLDLQWVPIEGSRSENFSELPCRASLDGRTEAVEWQQMKRPNAFNITVDIMPAIECYFNVIKQFVMKSKFPEEFIPIAREENICLVPKSCGRGCRECFQISFAKIEKRLMKKMDNIHKACYRILKKTFSMAQKFSVV